MKPLNAENFLSHGTSAAKPEVQLWPDDTGLFFITLMRGQSQCTLKPEKSIGHLWPENDKTNVQFTSLSVHHIQQHEKKLFKSVDGTIIQMNAVKKGQSESAQVRERKKSLILFTNCNVFKKRDHKKTDTDDAELSP